MNPEHKRRIGEAVALALYFILDALEIWLTWHGIALLAAAVGISVVSGVGIGLSFIAAARLDAVVIHVDVERAAIAY